MVLKAERKVPGGKLIRVALSLRGGRIEKVRITGDFFLHPEESIEDLEKRLEGVEATEASVKRAIEEFFDGSKTLIGASPTDFLLAIKSALSEG